VSKCLANCKLYRILLFDIIPLVKEYEFALMMKLLRSAISRMICIDWQYVCCTPGCYASKQGTGIGNSSFKRSWIRVKSARTVVRMR